MRVRVSWSSVSLSGIWRDRCSNCSVLFRWISFWEGLRGWYGSSNDTDWERENRSFRERLASTASLKKKFHLSSHSCLLGALLSQLAAAFRTDCRLMSVLIHVVAGWVLTTTSPSCCGQTQILREQSRSRLHFSNKINYKSKGILDCISITKEGLKIQTKFEMEFSCFKGRNDRKLIFLSPGEDIVWLPFPVTEVPLGKPWRN